MGDVIQGSEIRKAQAAPTKGPAGFAKLATELQNSIQASTQDGDFVTHGTALEDLPPDIRNHELREIIKRLASDCATQSRALADRAFLLGKQIEDLEADARAKGDQAHPTDQTWRAAATEISGHPCVAIALITFSEGIDPARDPRWKIIARSRTKFGPCPRSASEAIENLVTTLSMDHVMLDFSDPSTTPDPPSPRVRTL